MYFININDALAICSVSNIKAILYDNLKKGGHLRSTAMSLSEREVDSKTTKYQNN